MTKRTALLSLMLLTVATLSFAQAGDKSKRPSPPASAECKFSNGKTVKTDYSSPRAKGRKIYGGLVPFGEIWRTGANDATTFVTDSDVQVGGVNVPAGSYTIFTVPTKDSWKLVISKKTGEWGTQYPGAENDLVRVDMKVSALPAPAENFAINYADANGKSCTLQLDWETTRASVTVEQK